MKSVVLICALLMASAVAAQQTMPLYPGAIPGAIDGPDQEAVRDPKESYRFLLDISRPTLTAYIPTRRDANRAAIIILPGGSYRGVSIVKEGDEPAAAFQKMGIAAFVVKYRSPSAATMRERSLGPLADAQQAIRVVRQRASEWGVDPNRVGVMGFSAGGHLAATAATRVDAVAGSGDSINLRPNFLILVYPVIGMGDDLAHALSRSNLLGDSPSAEVMRAFSIEQQVTAATPPTFLVHAADDKSVNVANSLRFFEALQRQGVAAELHVYPRGGHGFGLVNPTTSDRWMDRCQAWLRAEGWLAGDRRR